MARDYKNLIVALDIGSQSVKAAAAEIDHNGQLKLAGVGVSASNGVKRGEIADIQSTVSSIHAAIKELETVADIQVKQVYTGVAGRHIWGDNHEGTVAIKDREVTDFDVTRAIENAQAIKINNEQKILLVRPQKYLVNNQEVKEAIGMSGVRLEVKVHIVIGEQNAADNILKCIRKCGLDVAGFYVNSIASGRAVLTHDEMELGVALLDIGAGTTDISVYYDGALQHTQSIPVAGDLITQDIAKAFSTPSKFAEELKIDHGCAKQLLVKDNYALDIVGIGERKTKQIGRQTLAAVIEPRVEEIYTLAQQIIQQSGFKGRLSSGFVLTGGSALLSGIVELGEDIFLNSGRIAVPNYYGGLSDMVAKPQMSTVIGLLDEGKESYLKKYNFSVNKMNYQNVFNKLKDWLVKAF